MYYKKAKRIIYILLAFALTLFCAVTLINIVSFINHKPVQREIEASINDYDVKYWIVVEDATGNSIDILQNYPLEWGFSIQSYSGLKSLMHTGYDFSGRTVILGQDIDCGDATLDRGSLISPGNILSNFAGTFDGQGYSIKNLRCNLDYGEAFFCGNNYGTIKNIKFDNIYLFVQYDIFHSESSLITYNNYGRVENCIVNNVTFKSDLNATFAPLASYNYATIRNCLISGNYIFGGKAHALSDFDVDAYPFVHNKDSKEDDGHRDAEMCIMRATPTQGTGDGWEESANDDYIGDNGGFNWGTNYNYKSGDFANLTSKSAEGGQEGSAWYYFGKDDNSTTNYDYGWPMLRIFIKDWKKISFKTDEGGTIDKSEIYIPSDAVYNATISSQKVEILGQIVTATADAGYIFKEWKKNNDSLYTAYFEKEKLQIKFQNATGTTDGDIIEPSETLIIIYVGTEITPSHPDGSRGEFTLIYTVKDTNGTEHNVKYNIPAKYKLKQSNHKDTTVIWPTLELNTFTVTLKVASGTNITSDTQWTVLYNERIEYSGTISGNTNINFTYNGTTITYTAKTSEGYKFDYLIIKKDGAEANISTLSSITGDIEIQPVFVRWFNVIFKKIDNTTEPTSDQIVEMKENTTITANFSADRKTLTYSGGVVYKASQFYILKGSNVKITKDTIITPETEFYACEVTIWKDDTENKAKLYVDDVEQTSSYKFIVDFGTTVTFTATQSESKFTYTYEFKQGSTTISTINYIIQDGDYAMSSEINSGNRVWHTELESITQHIFDGPEGFTLPTEEMKSYSISPTFELKEYGGELA